MKYLVLFSNCFLVRGFKRSIICDVVRSRYDFIPNSLYDVLNRHNKTELSVIRASFGEKDQEVLDSYLTFLQSKEYVFFTDHPEMFPDVEISWENPSLITNAVIDLDSASDHDLEKIISELDDLRCIAIEIRTFDAFDLPAIRRLIDPVRTSGFRSVQLLLKYHPSYNAVEFKQILADNQRIMSITVHSTTDEELTRIKPNDSTIFFIKNKIESESHCGAISKFNFSSNIYLFMESQFYNNCLNRKIAVDKWGKIRNCPSMGLQFGHHKETSLRDALLHPAFKEYWTVRKDEIAICKDCEFRYICTDCRAYTTNGSDKYAKPAKCGYDPYTATWEQA